MGCHEDGHTPELIELQNNALKLTAPANWSAAA
jgi:hypothetical protein